METNGRIDPITIDQVTAAGGVTSGHPSGVVSILGLDGLFTGRTDYSAAISSGNLFLEGGDSSGIGLWSAPLVIDLAPGVSWRRRTPGTACMSRSRVAI